MYGIHRVLDHTKDVETGQDGLGELDVLLERDRRIVASPDRVRCSDDGASSLESGDNARLGDGDRLLFHSLVDGGTVSIIHLVELVDQAGALVREYERTTLQRPLTCDGVLAYARRKTNSGRPLTRSEHGTVGGLLDILQELRLSGTRISEEENVDIATDAVLAVDVLGNTSEKGQSDGGFDVLMAVDRRSNGLDDTFADPVIARKSTNFLLVVLSKTECRELVLFLIDMVRLKDGGKDWEAIFGIEGCIKVVTVDTSDFLYRSEQWSHLDMQETYDFLSRLRFVNEVPKKDDFAMPRQTTGRN